MTWCAVQMSPLFSLDAIWVVCSSWSVSQLHYGGCSDYLTGSYMPCRLPAVRHRLHVTESCMSYVTDIDKLKMLQCTIVSVVETQKHVRNF